ncbi:MAG: dTDP-4-dehydrorhamnose 3,5-epimerase [Rubricoccaceae bacterium]
MTVTELALPGLRLVEPVVHGDARGFFVERYHVARYASAGIPEPGAAFVQDNHSRSRQGTLRGLHFQRRHPQGKLIEVLAGRVYDVVVDVRAGSPTFGRWLALTLDAEQHRQLYVPPGYAHGFCVLSDTADFLYKCTEVYRADDEGGIRWDDPTLGIPWPLEAPLVSDKDARLPRLRDLRPADLPGAP